MLTVEDIKEDDLIKFISYHSPKNGQLLLDFLEKNNMQGLINANKKQLLNYIIIDMKKTKQELFAFVEKNKNKIFVTPKYLENNSNIDEKEM